MDGDEGRGSQSGADRQRGLPQGSRDQPRPGVVLWVLWWWRWLERRWDGGSVSNDITTSSIFQSDSLAKFEPPFRPPPQPSQTLQTSQNDAPDMILQDSWSFYPLLTDRHGGFSGQPCESRLCPGPIAANSRTHSSHVSSLWAVHRVTGQPDASLQTRPVGQNSGFPPSSLHGQWMELAGRSSDSSCPTAGGSDYQQGAWAQPSNFAQELVLTAHKTKA
ncbi:hypothetical protein QBC41DRAFT_321168 [Cercophora samala]|uniref:Uncharacterized protein n=1 Tax=Cercophora samala TaxID=330535 RepID=A0AA39ZDZ8_9PEZI|nr:hypothetical protein QBC41DRAFT_321168 [Cercophora samala]